MVGTSGAAATRFGVVTASARNFPALAADIAGGMVEKTNVTSPPRMAWVAGLLPLYGANGPRRARARRITVSDVHLQTIKPAGMPVDCKDVAAVVYEHTVQLRRRHVRALGCRRHVVR